MQHRLRRLYINAYAGLPLKVWYLSLIMLINRSGAMVVPFLTVFLTIERGYSPAKAGWVMVAFGLGGVVGNYVGGLLNDRFGSWHIQVFSLFGSGFVFISLAYIQDYTFFCLTIFLLSIVADVFRPANRAAVAIYTAPDQLVKAYGLQRMAINLGFSIGPIAAGYILTFLGYHSLFWIDGLTCIFSGLAFIWLLPSDETAKPLQPKTTSPKAGASLDTPLTSISLPAHRNSQLIIICLANVFIAACFFQLFSTVPVYMESLDYTTVQIGWLFTVSGLIIVVFEMPLLYLTKAHYPPLRMMVFGAILIALSYFILPPAISYSMVAVVFSIIILTFGEILYMPFSTTYISLKAPPERRGEYLGLLAASYSLAFVLCPIVGLNGADLLGFGPITFALAGAGSFGVCLLLIALRKEESAAKVLPKHI